MIVKTTMKSAPKILGWLHNVALIVPLSVALIVALLIASGTTATFASDRASSTSGDMADRGESDVGCHAHATMHSRYSDRALPGSPLANRRVPRQPRSPDYRCCLTGHDVALVQVSQSSQAWYQAARSTFEWQTSEWQTFEWQTSEWQPWEWEPSLAKFALVDDGQTFTALSADPLPGMPLRI